MYQSKIYLNSFYPLCSTKHGIKAINKYGLQKYIDGSCRREPDLENELPCITGLCRPGFAEKLNEEDIIIYVTNKKGVGSRKLISVLKVTKIFESHEVAADWYIAQNKCIPNNLMVDGNRPFDLNKTHQKMGWDAWTKQKQTLDTWDKSYYDRANDKGKVALCEILYRELNNPIQLDESKFERKLIAQNPPVLKIEEWNIIRELIKL